MMFRKDRKMAIFFGLFLFMILIGVLINVFIRPMRLAGIFLIICGLIGLITGIRISTKPTDHFKEDERSDHIKEKAGFHAYELMWKIAILVSGFHVLKLSPSLTPSEDFVTGALLIGVVGLFYFLVLKWYYNKKVELAVGLAFLAAGILLDNFGAVGVGSAFSVISIYDNFKYGDLPERDERTIRASGHAAGATLFALFLSITAFTLMDKFKLLTLTVSRVLAVLFFILVFVLSLSFWYFNRKGDVK